MPSALQKVVLSMIFTMACTDSSTTMSSAENSAQIVSQVNGQGVRTEIKKNSNGLDEKVSPPQVITGSWLSCMEVPVVPSSLEALVHCALKNNDELVDLSQAFSSFEWAVEDIGDVRIETLPMESNSHVAVKFSGSTQDELDTKKKKARYILKAVDTTIEAHHWETRVNNSKAFWLRLGAEAMPPLAIPVGSESNGERIIRLCRIYYDGVVIPGKAIATAMERAGNADCIATWEGRTVHALKANGSVAYPSDILMASSNEVDQGINWVKPTTAHSPAQALIAGRNGDRPLYACRGLDNGDGTKADTHQKPNNPAGEFTTGYVNKDGLCVWELFGERSAADFEILVENPVN